MHRMTCGSLLILLIVLLLASSVTNAQKLKVYISADMEGITGVVSADQTGAGPDYGMARKWMTDDVNAAIVGALEAGATEVVVNDSHGDMRNILPGELNPNAALISGSPKPFGMMQGIDASFDAVMFVGYHARAGTVDAVLDHTISSAVVYSIRINGIEMPELGINALVAGYYNVPVVMLSGDRSACEQAKEVLGEKTVVAQVKEAIGRTAAKNLSFEGARKLIRQQAKSAIEKRKELKPYKLNAPYRFELAYFRSSQTDNALSVRGVKRISPRAVQFESEDFIVGCKLLRALISLGRDN
ncbi:MAG: M55 family metallopeptidase [Ignavibacteriales bacterium]|nr:M55 family metallopeptidase [Ignavibacteriales bacterium]